MFLGVDGGGTKTVFCLVDRSGYMVARAQAASSYYFPHGIELVERVLKDGIDAVCAAAGLTPADIEHAFFGLPGYGEAARDLPTLNATPRAVLGHDRYACDNDMVCKSGGSSVAPGAADGDVSPVMP